MADHLPPSVATLAELRRRLGRSQAEIASATGTTQSGVSRLEHQSDMHVSTLGEYVGALGGRLRLFVEHGTDRTEIAIPSLRGEDPEQPREFRVIWQDQESRSLVHVAWLQFTGAEFRFSYLEEAGSHPRFRPFPAFPLLKEVYRSADLFPYFAVRLTSAADPGYEAVLHALGLSREAATPVELLARSPSESPHDTIQVVPEPTELPDGTLVREFLASGVRHANPEDSAAVGRIIANLRTDAPLELVPEPFNPHNSRALHLSVDGERIGWVPDYLTSEIHGHINSKRPLAVAVVRANGPDAPWHLRLLCRLTVKSETCQEALGVGG